ncbi:hypothetical protein [Streptomyces nanshensis]|uniref:Uncharacterized protein n=1 Tax=Streptomyces nanshensis TaxID=518642 RepID=A0A1E7L3V1_9ACTN|nr:hypothetical protein [Streptomyces nanshensis]OEV10867.1 hypothetical protein AN218_15595 [Streptomyces nanshensis]
MGVADTAPVLGGAGLTAYAWQTGVPAGPARAGAGIGDAHLPAERYVRRFAARAGRRQTAAEAERIRAFRHF